MADKPSMNRTAPKKYHLAYWSSKDIPANWAIIFERDDNTEDVFVGHLALVFYPGHVLRYCYL